jgi:hypothetical protein
MVVKQNQVFSSDDNTIDPLLQSTFNFTDVMDSATIISVIDESIQDHISKVRDI